MVGLGCSAVALSLSGSGGVSAFLDPVFVPDTAAIPVRGEHGVTSGAAMRSRFLVVLVASLAHGRECGYGVCGGEWMYSFDRAGWSKCKQGCAMTGMCRV